MVRKETGILLVVLADLTCDPFLLDFWKNILYIRRSVIERFYLECFAYNYTIGSSIISIHWIINAIRLMKTIRKRSRYCDQRLAFCSLRIQPFLLTATDVSPGGTSAPQRQEIPCWWRKICPESGQDRALIGHRSSYIVLPIVYE